MEKIVSDAMRNGAIAFLLQLLKGLNSANGVPMHKVCKQKEISRLIKSMAIDGRNIYVTKSNNTEIKDIINLLEELKDQQW